MFGCTSSQGKVYNFIHRDEIWKTHVVRDLQSQKKWAEQWGYLYDEYQKLQESLLSIGSELEDEIEAKLALKLEQNLEQNLECGVLKLEEVEGISLVRSEALTDCTVKRDTTSHVARLHVNAKGRSDTFKLFKWPREAVM